MPPPPAPAPDAQSLADDLDVDVTIADMPREACQIVSIRSGDFNQRLGPPNDADDRAVVEHQAVAPLAAAAADDDHGGYQTGTKTSRFDLS